MKACAMNIQNWRICPNCLRIRDGEWTRYKLEAPFFWVKPYENRRVAWEVCPECRKMRDGGMITVCAFCNRVRNDAGDWVDCDFDPAWCKNASHTYCPQCVAVNFPDLHSKGSLDTI